MPNKKKDADASIDEALTDQTRPAAKRRLVFEFSDEAYSLMSTLKERTGASSNVEVVRDALRLYDVLVENIRQGWTLQFVNGTRARELLLPIARPDHFPRSERAVVNE